MIETREKHIVYVTLHDKRTTDIYKEMYPDRPECWDSPIDVDITDIYKNRPVKNTKSLALCMK